ncbi:Hypothetical predicted protein [Paramuricea clavata]|uniref:Uncharacterized protein n=1 Tax=Paramuricea clavata TaxID=317549 RepID=A0A6S7KQ58_PARCT|nr:Hypothetical predicted protein [Paramuricea clavata]
MSSTVTSILSSTVGLLWNKARDSTAAKLKDGDVADAKVREIVVRELNDIKTKLDGLSRKDLLSSSRFLKEGVDLLYVSLDKSKLEQKAVMDPTQQDRGETSGMSSGVDSGILSEALELSHAMGKMKIYSDKEFESAKERFKDARKRATDAFCNEALNINDRIFAAKLRVVSEILECLDSPQTAITGCLSFLQDLHSLPAVCEMFDVYLNGGVKSLLGKAERVENVKSVILINYVLFNLKSKFSRRFTDRLTWPGIIELTDRTFNPILDWQEVSTRKSMGNELGQAPKRLILDDAIRPRLSAVDSHGNVVVGECGKCNINVIQRTGETKVVHELPDCGEGKVIDQGIVGLAVDKNNNVYVVRWVKTHTENCDVECYVLNVLDENYNVKHRCRFDFLQVTITIPYVTSPYFHVVWITIHTNNNMIMIKNGDSNVYVCDNVGQLKHKFEPHSVGIPWLGISNKDEIMIPSHDGTAVHFHSEEGNLKSTVQLPEGHRVLGVALHHVICKIIVLTFVRDKDSYFLVCYTETGELETSTLFSEDDDIKWSPSITSHPSGPVAVVREKTITFI